MPGTRIRMNYTHADIDKCHNKYYYDNYSNTNSDYFYTSMILTTIQK